MQIGTGALGSWPRLPALKHNLVTTTADLVSSPNPESISVTLAPKVSVGGSIGSWSRTLTLRISALLKKRRAGMVTHTCGLSI